MKKIISFFLITIFISIFSLQLLSQNDTDILRATYIEENIVLHTPTGDIFGTLLIPDYPNPVPVVLIIAGSGPTDRDGNQPSMKTNSLKYLSEGLEQHYIASLRFDKRGIGESQSAGEKEEDLRFENYIEDVKLWIDLLSTDQRFSSIIVVGHSEGSLIGMVACENNEKVNAFISIAGVATPADEILMEQMDKQPKLFKEKISEILAELKQGKTVTDVPPILNPLFRQSVQPYMISWIKYNPQEEIKKLQIPVLIIQGTTDIQVAVYHADLLEQKKPKSQKILIDNMNHELKHCESMEQNEQLATYKNPDLPIVEELVEVISAFILK